MSESSSKLVPRPVMLDTCAAIWIMGGDKLSSASEAALLAARSSRSGIYVSPFSSWEIGMLVAKGRFNPGMTPSKWFDRLLAFPGVRLAELTPEILLGSTAMPGVPPKDPADRIIGSTARTLGLLLLTRDRLMIDYAGQGYIRAIEC